MTKSSKPRKQRREIYKGKFNRLKREMKSHLSKSLKEKYKKRGFKIKTDDIVKIMRGKFKGKEGKIEKVSLRRRKIYIEGIQRSKADGTFAKIGISPSNVMITKFDLKDKKRKLRLEEKIKIKEAPKKEAKKWLKDIQDIEKE